MKIYIGSQLGNSRGVADELIELLQYYDKNVNIFVRDLNDLIDDNKQEDVLIICSTTGNGDIPDNGSKLWRTIKKRDFNKVYFDGLRYLILGLGDTNYSEFCGAAKKLTKRLQELGATELSPLVTIDDETNDYDEKIDVMYTLLIKQLYQE